jgi:protein TonB
MATVQTGYVENDQIGFYLFLAFAVHLMFILGVGFVSAPERSFTPQLEVTLARYKSSQAPEESRYIAQVNQEGSGTEAEQLEITTRRIADFSDTRIRQTSAAPKLTQPQPQTRDQKLLTTVNEALESLFSEPREKEPDPMLAEGIDPEVNKLTESIASLEARLDEQQQSLAQKPRVRRLTSLSARRATDAAYLHNWRSRVEEVGNRHYPLASSRYGIYGDLRLMVAIKHDGSIDNIEILASSGHAVLDEAAIRIVRMAAPYEPFPPDLRSTTDMLEIIRTWKFRENRLSSVQG